MERVQKRTLFIVLAIFFVVLVVFLIFYKNFNSEAKEQPNVGHILQFPMSISSKMPPNQQTSKHLNKNPTSIPNILHPTTKVDLLKLPLVVSKTPRSSATAAYLSISPFYRHEKQISDVVKNYIESNQDKDALLVLREVVANERKWRLDLCLQLFGQVSCQRNPSLNEPFFMWKKKLVYDLLADPTQEIIDKIRKNIHF